MKGRMDGSAAVRRWRGGRGGLKAEEESGGEEFCENSQIMMTNSSPHRSALKLFDESKIGTKGLAVI